MHSSVLRFSNPGPTCNTYVIGRSPSFWRSTQPWRGHQPSSVLPAPRLCDARAGFLRMFSSGRCRSSGYIGTKGRESISWSLTIVWRDLEFTDTVSIRQIRVALDRSASEFRFPFGVHRRVRWSRRAPQSACAPTCDRRATWSDGSSPPISMRSTQRNEASRSADPPPRDPYRPLSIRETFEWVRLLSRVSPRWRDGRYENQRRTPTEVRMLLRSHVVCAVPHECV